ncbi:hypothetical protein BC936DRAFT_139614, partial [Jimgerdemannia flammicorona]
EKQTTSVFLGSALTFARTFETNIHKKVCWGSSLPNTDSGCFLRQRRPNIPVYYVLPSDTQPSRRMSLLDFFGGFLYCWFVVHLVVFLLNYCGVKKAKVKPWLRASNPEAGTTYLPTTSASASSSSTLSIKLFNLRYTTTWFNPMFTRLAEWAPRFWEVWFTIGVWFGLLAMFVGVGVLVFAAYKIGLWALKAAAAVVFASSSRAAAASASLGRNSLVKRAYEDDPVLMGSADTEMDDGGNQVFVPVIPGVTLPISHIGYYLLALLVSGVFHEAGHAIAAAREGIPINNAGIFLYILYPGAFVDIPSRTLALLPPLRQLRVICAGVWHNAVLYLGLSLALSVGLKIGFQLIGWKLLEATGGVAIVAISQNSALYGHLSISSVIYRLDDTYLDNNIKDWNDFLLSLTNHDTQNGFCVGIKELSDDPLDCCQIDAENPFSKSSNPSLSCFERFSHQKQPPEHSLRNPFCLPSLNILASSPPHERCETDFDCGGVVGGICMTPYAPFKAGRVLRIYFKWPPWHPEAAKMDREKEDEKSVVFIGELVDVWESVQVSVLQPQYSFLPVWLPHVIEMTLSYTCSFTLALSLLNILPAFHLDGEYALTTILSIVYPSREETMSTSGHNARARKRIEHSLIWCTSILVGFVVAGSLVTGIVQTAKNGGAR